MKNVFPEGGKQKPEHTSTEMSARKNCSAFHHRNWIRTLLPVVSGLMKGTSEMIRPRKDAMDGRASNIVLIGMPGSGKSTIGVVLAKCTSMHFVDTDILIQCSVGRSLQDIVDGEGHMALRAIEENVLLGLDCRNHVIATGGSAVYSHPAMEHLKSDGLVVFLEVELGTLKSRIHDYETRGLAKRPDQTFEELFAERSSLYSRYADLTIRAAGMSVAEVCASIIKEWSGQEQVCQ